MKSIFGENKDDELKTVLYKIGFNHLLKKETLGKKFDNQIQSLSSTKILSDESVLIATLSKQDKDYDNQSQYHHTLQYLKFEACFLYLAMDELRKRFSKENILDYFKKSFVFKNGNQEFLIRAISAYWDKDYLISSHLFNPLIEKGS